MQNPLSSQGYPVDIESRRPLKIDPRKEELLNRVVTDKQNMLNDLAEKGGEVVKEVIGLYVKRIEQLVQLDPEAQAYEKILQAIDYKVNAGERIVAERIKSIRS